MERKIKTYDLEYWIGKKHIATVCKNKPYALIVYNKKTLKNTTHKLGLFKIKLCENNKQ